MSGEWVLCCLSTTYMPIPVAGFKILLHNNVVPVSKEFIFLNITLSYLNSKWIEIELVRVIWLSFSDFNPLNTDDWCEDVHTVIFTHHYYQKHVWNSTTCIVISVVSSNINMKEINILKRVLQMFKIILNEYSYVMIVTSGSWINHYKNSPTFFNFNG